MPTYDYKCKNCGYVFEVFQGITKKPKRKCPECGKLKLQRLIGAGGGVLFKGGGWPGQEITRSKEKQGNGKEENRTKKKVKGAEEGGV